MAHINFSKLELQDYLKPGKIDTELAKFIFLIRSRMLEVKSNFKSSHSSLLCDLCKEGNDTQEHLLDCK